MEEGARDTVYAAGTAPACRYITHTSINAVVWRVFALPIGPASKVTRAALEPLNGHSPSLRRLVSHDEFPRNSDFLTFTV